MDSLRYSPNDPYYRLGAVHTCLYVGVRETGLDQRYFLPFQGRIRVPLVIVCPRTSLFLLFFEIGRLRRLISNPSRTVQGILLRTSEF